MKKHTYLSQLHILLKRGP